MKLKISDRCKTALFFKGRFDTFPEIGEVGDVIIVDRGEYVWSGRWEKLGEIESENAEEQAAENKKEQNKALKPKICKQCGAPLNGFKCEYCGTEYDKITKMKNDSLSYLLQAGGISVKTAMRLF